MLQHVRPQPRLRSVGFPTVRTHAELLWLGVDVPSVIRARLRAAETLPAEITYVRPFSGVRVFVGIKKVTEMKTFATLLTSEGFLSGVNALVSDHV